MARRIKGKYYDLNQTFSDEEGNRYSRRAADTLVLWMNMGGAPTDKGPKSLTVSYEGSPTTSTSALVPAGTIRDTVQFDDSPGNMNGKVNGNAALSPSSLATLGTPTATSDLPFSLSFWVNMDDVSAGSAHHLLCSKVGYSDRATFDCGVYYDSGKPWFAVYDSNVGSYNTYKSIKTAADQTSTIEDKWAHIACTYDGSASSAGMVMYINGDVASTVVADNGSYVGMKPDHSKPLYVGAKYDGSQEVDGQMAEFCMWNDYALNASDVKALYNVSAHDRGTASGQLGNPVRTVLRDLDTQIGSYPTIARTGDSDFLGQFTSTFDDSNTIVFSGANLVYPTNLIAGSKFVSGGIATPSVLGGLLAAGTSSAGTADSHVFFPPVGMSQGENISPFNESRTYIDDGLKFYTTGTASGTLPGFDQRLSSKTIINLNFNNTVTENLYFTTGSWYRHLDEGFTVNSKTYDVAGSLLNQWRMDSTVRSGSAWAGSANRAYPACSGAASFGGILTVTDRPAEVTWVGSLRPDRPYNNDFYAGSTYFSASHNTYLMGGGVADAMPADVGTAFSLSFWVKWDVIDAFRSPDSASNFASTSRLWSFFNLAYECGITPDGRLWFDAWTSGDVREYKTEAGFVTEGPWYFLTFAYDEDATPKLWIYKNGTQRATITTVAAGSGDDIGISGGDIFYCPGGHSTGGVSTQIASQSAGVYCDISLHKKQIDVDNHGAMYYAASYPTVHSNTGLAYLNFKQNKWSIIGASGSVDYMNPQPAIASASFLAFTPKYLGGTIGTADSVKNSSLVARTVGMPTDLCGFPHHSKFDPTNEQLFSLSGSLTSPFLLEKIVYEFSAALPPRLTRTNGSSGDGPECTQIFLMRHGNESYNSTQLPTFTQIVSGGQYVPGIFDKPLGSDLQYSFSSLSVVTGGNNYLVDVGTIANAAIFSDGYHRDLNHTTDSAVTGTFRVNSTAKVFGATSATALKANRLMGAAGAGHGALWLGNGAYAAKFPGMSVGLLRNQMGGRDGLGIATSDGRSFIKGVVGSEVSSSLSLNYLGNPGGSVVSAQTDLDAQTNFYTAPTYKEVSFDSPYVLFPNDKISVGLCYHPFQAQEGSSYDLLETTELKIGQISNALQVSPGGVNITLFGSLLRNNLPVEPVSNQPLTSNAVHEVLQFDTPVYDQFDVEPYLSLTGSYVDNVISGSMFADLHNKSSARDKFHIRRVVNSVTSGQAGTTGSLQRFTRLTDPVGTMYDSHPPDPADVLFLASVDSNGNPRGWFSSISGETTTKHVFMSPGLPTQGIAAPDTSWYLYSAYEKSSSRLLPGKISAKHRPTFNDDGTNIGSLPLVSQRTIFLYSTVFKADGNYTFISDDDGGINTLESHKNSIKALWGFGRALFNSPEWGVVASKRAVPRIRGYKYGLAGLFGSKADARFRRDRYGQFRDMLEQRKYPATLLARGSVDYPLEIAFKSREGGVTDPSKTHSQNLSQFSSSSKPYFDGLAVDRADDPDVTLDPIDVT